jgi:hypothetical protein
MATVTGEMIARFGGLDRFVATWKDAVDLAAREGKHYLVSRSLVAVLNLTVASTRIDEAQNQTTDVDDEDLERQFDQAVLRIVAGHPELALRAAQQLGWTLIPPERAGH